MSETVVLERGGGVAIVIERENRAVSVGSLGRAVAVTISREVAEGPPGPPGPQGPAGDGASADPGDLTLIFDNKLI